MHGYTTVMISQLYNNNKHQIDILNSHDILNTLMETFSQGLLIHSNRAS